MDRSAPRPCPIGPRAEHRIWVSALLAEIILPAIHVRLLSLWQQACALGLWAWDLGRDNGPGQVKVRIGPAIVSDAGLHLPAAMLAVIEAAYVLALVYFAMRLASGLWKTHRLLRSSQPLAITAGLAARCARHRLESQSNQPVKVAISPLVSSPVTMGLLRHLLLLPPAFVDRVTEADMDAVFAHEFAHIERRDFAKNLLYEIISLPIAYHPALWLTAARLAESREMVCDESAASLNAGRDSYARALLRLASMLTEPMPIKTLHAIGIFDANIFERRIMSLTQKRNQLPRARQIAIAAACAFVALLACASALALRMSVASPAAQTQNPKYLQVKQDSMKVVSRVQPVYPKAAKEARVEGSVIIGTVISKDGVPEKLKVISGPKDLQHSAIEAVSHWRWEPYLLNGDPIEVETTVTVVYSLKK
jgi:TonB family protein